MNDKIKELAEQADCSIDGMGYGEGCIEWLAELIVRECAQHVVQRDVRLDVEYASAEVSEHYRMVYDKAKYNIGLELLKKFGIEK